MKFHKIGDVLKHLSKADRSDFDLELEKLVSSGEIKVYAPNRHTPNRPKATYVPYTHDLPIEDHATGEKGLCRYYCLHDHLITEDDSNKLREKLGLEKEHSPLTYQKIILGLLLELGLDLDDDKLTGRNIGSLWGILDKHKIEIDDDTIREVIKKVKPLEEKRKKGLLKRKE